MIVSDYPDSTDIGADVLTVIDQPQQFQFERYVFEDGAAAVNVQPCGLQRWELFYDGLTDTQRNVILAHYNEAMGNVNEFTFVHPRTSVSYSGVKYEKLDFPHHNKRWTLGAHVVLQKLI